MEFKRIVQVDELKMVVKAELDHLADTDDNPNHADHIRNTKHRLIAIIDSYTIKEEPSK